MEMVKNKSISFHFNNVDQKLPNEKQQQQHQQKYAPHRPHDARNLIFDQVMSHRIINKQYAIYSCDLTIAHCGSMKMFQLKRLC